MTDVSAQPKTFEAALNHDERTVTIAVTLRWNPVWALDKCSAGSTVGRVGQAIAEALQDDDKVLGFSYSCVDPNEEVDLGYIADYNNARCTACKKPVRWTNERWRAPEFWEHVDIPAAGEPLCSNLNGSGGVNGYVVEFPNQLERRFDR